MNKIKLRRRPTTRRNKGSLHKTLSKKCAEKDQDLEGTISLPKSNSRSSKVKKGVSKINTKNIIDVIKCITGSSSETSDNSFSHNSIKLSKRESTESVIYIGTTYLCSPQVPRKDSVIDLTKSDTSVGSSWESNYNLENYDISGDNIVDELHLKDPTITSTATIFTIFPPKSSSLFFTPSDEMCSCQKHNTRQSALKRNLSLTDITLYADQVRSKKRVVSKCKLDKLESDSGDCVWKLKKSYPLSNGLCEHHDRDDSIEHMDYDLTTDADLMDIVDDIQKEFNISSSEHCGIIDDLQEVTVLPIVDSCKHL